MLFVTKVIPKSSRNSRIRASFVNKITAKQFGKYIYIEIFPAEIVFLGFLQVKGKLLPSYFQNKIYFIKIFSF